MQSKRFWSETYNRFLQFRMVAAVIKRVRVVFLPACSGRTTLHKHRLPLLLKGRERAPWCIAVTHSSAARKRSLPLPLNGGGSFRLYREGDKARVI